MRKRPHKGKQRIRIPISCPLLRSAATHREIVTRSAANAIQSRAVLPLRPLPSVGTPSRAFGLACPSRYLVFGRESEQI